MAIHENLANSIANKEKPFEELWENHSGMEVEDFITRNLITDGNYDSNSEVLSLKKADGKTIDIPVSVQTPTYIYGIINYGVRLDGTVYNGNEMLMLYRNGRKVELGIAIQSVADRSGTLTTVQKPFDVAIKFNNQTIIKLVYPISHEYFAIEGGGLKLNIPEGVNIEDVIVWVDVTELFKKSFKNKTFETSFKQLNQETNTIVTYSSVLNTFVTNEVINLTYLGEVVVKNNYIQMLFDPSSTDTSKYYLVGFNGTELFTNNVGDMMVSNLKSGLNQILVKAININNPDIYTDWYYVDIIYSVGVTETVVAVNGVSNGITNNGVATLYELTVYSPNTEEVTITTYLEDEEPSDNPKPTNIIKSEIINPSQYNKDTKTLKSEYKKYIEINSDNAMKYLLVNVDDEFYSFYVPEEIKGNYYNYLYSYKALEVENIIEEYTYTKTYTANYNFDLIGGYINNVFVTKEYGTTLTPANISDTLESSDGWLENEGRAYFKVSAQEQPIFTTPLNLNLGNNFTIELGVKTYNVSNIDKTILTLGKLQLRPTMVCWDVNRLAYEDSAKGEEAYQAAFLKRVSKFQEGVETHIMITVDSNWTVNKNDLYYPDYLGDNQSVFDSNAANYSHVLLRIYINGVIDREVFLETSELTELRNSLLQINPTTADINFYLFRVYNNNSLNFSEILKNYISFLPNKTGKDSKEEIYTKNDILGDDGTISWERCREKLNTLLFVFPKGGKFPNRFWGGEDGNAEEDVNKKLWTSLFIGYADPEINVKYGGKLTHLQVKGLGSSAMRYLIWNVNSSLNKFKDADDNKIKSIFTPNGLLNPDSIPEGYTGIETLSETKGKYIMPTYSGKVDQTEYGYTKMVGKVNYASSMQSHKIGACKLFDDAYKSKVVSKLPSGGLKAVHEEPFLYFYIESDLSNEACAALTWDEILTMTDQIKFMGFQTWGPGKGDDTCSGYDEDKTPEYLMLEGGENGDNSVNFLVPWHNLQRLDKTLGEAAVTYEDLNSVPVCTKDESLANPGKWLLIDDESIVYRESGAWDIDYGIEEVEDNVNFPYFKFADGVMQSPGGNEKSSLQWFREFYDFVYKYDFTFVVEPNSVNKPEDTWDVTKKHLVVASTFYPDGVNKAANHQAYDIYRYDAVNESWVPAGLYYNNDYENQWDRLNPRYLMPELGISTSATEAVIRANMRGYFMDHIGNYVDINDISFHQAFVKFLSGTDNRAKNTYFLIIGPLYEKDPEGNFVMTLNGDYKIRLIGDDLDTILATDNNGLQSKSYNLVEDSYDESYASAWGDLGNIFFRMYDICFEDDIKSKLTGIMTQAGISPSSVNNTGTYFYNTFFKVQEDFPAIAYNHTAKIYYENAAIIKEVGLKATFGNGYTFSYKHNDVEPIEQSHGSSLECERLFMKERLAYLAGYANASLDGYMATGRSGGSGASLRLQLDFVPFQDFYPIYQFGTSVDAGYKSFGDLQTAPASLRTWEEYQISSNTRRKVALRDNEYSVRLNETSSAINQGLYQVNMYKSLSITGLSVPDLTGSFDRATSFEIDNSKLSNSFFSGWSLFTMNANQAQLPVIQNLSLRFITLPDTISLLTYYKLKTLDLTGSTTKYVEFPQTGNLSEVILPSTITEFRIYNNPGLTKVEVLSTTKDLNGNTVTYYDISNLKTVYIDCAKCGKFDVTEFCELLIDVSLDDVKLLNCNLKLTEKALLNLCIDSCKITGIVEITDELTYRGKQILVEKFGNIDNEKNTLYIKYNLIEPSITVDDTYNIYYDDKTGGTLTKAITPVITGNDIAIIYDDKWVLNTLFALITPNTSDVVTIDKYSGIVTMNSQPKDGNVKITVFKKSGGNLNPVTSVVTFKWIAALVGEFVYTDGTFSKSGNLPNKTLMGIIYDREGNADMGKYYVMGAERTYTVPFVKYLSNSESNLLNFDISSYLKVIESNLNISPVKLLNAGNEDPVVIDNINYDSNSEDNIKNNTAISNTYKNGKSETDKYAEIVTQELLKTLYNKGIKGIDLEKQVIEENGSNVEYTEYKISDLITVCNSLKNIKLANYTISDNFKFINTAILNPYFYSAYMYKPKNLCEEFKDIKWFAPSLGELSRVIYLFVLSLNETISDTTSSNIFNNDILFTNNGNYSNDFNTGLFTIINNSDVSETIKDLWISIIKGNMITKGKDITIVTTQNDGDCYGYVKDWNSYDYTNKYPIYHAKWCTEVYESGNYGGTNNYLLSPYYESHGPVPFTEIDYINPTL